LIGVRPDAVVSSPSMRTRETALIMSMEYGITDVRYVDDLYIGKNPKTRHSQHIYLDAIQQASPDTEILMVVGHNEEITDFARYLSDDGVPTMKK
jgi:phosphohistidine phosphatase SixA